MTSRTVPVWPSRDIDATADTYARLGFTVGLRQVDPEPYLILRREDVELHFFCVPHLDPGHNHAMAYLEVDDADALHDTWSAAGLHRVTPVEDKPWGLREFAFVDDDGNLMRVAQRPRQ